MMCDNCGKPLGEEDDVADVEIDLSRRERYDLVWCRNCTVELVPQKEAGV